MFYLRLVSGISGYGIFAYFLKGYWDSCFFSFFFFLLTLLLFWYSLRTAEGLNWSRVGYLPLESNISNWSNVAYLKTKVDMLFFTIKHCQKGHGAGVKVGKCMRVEIFFLRFNPPFFPPFSFSFLPFFCFFLRISYAGPFRPLLIGVDRAALRRYRER